MVNAGDLWSGLTLLFSFEALLYCFIGVALGTFVGVLPGIGAMTAIALLLPITYQLEPITSLVMLAGIYYGTQYGGSTASILLNMPGTPTTAVTCLDGYPMMKQGRGGVALLITAISSFIGSIIGTVALALFAPPLAQIAISFGSAEYLSLVVLGLLAVVLFSEGSVFRSLAAISIGALLGTVGIDINTGEQRFTFGLLSLYDGVALTAVALGIFGLAEVIANVGQVEERGPAQRISLRSMLPTGDDWPRSLKAALRGTAIGSFFGVLPGAGGVMASFMSYALEKRVSKNSAEFGHGAIEGIAGPEAANNANAQTAFIPTLTLGLPGDAVMALIVSAMMIQGVTPGPSFLHTNPALFWALVFSFVIGNAMLLVLNIPLVGLWVRLLNIPYRTLYPAIVVLICCGIYSVGTSVADVVTVAVMGVLGYGMRLLRFAAAPLLLGFVLGPLMEEHFRRALLLSSGHLSTFVSSWISVVILGAVVLMVLSVVVRQFRSRRQAAVGPSPADEEL